MAKLRVLAHEVDDDDFRGFAAAMPHWNGQIPGDWSKLIRADAVRH